MYRGILSVTAPAALLSKSQSHTGTIDDATSELTHPLRIKLLDFGLARSSEEGSAKCGIWPNNRGARIRLLRH